MYITLNDPNGDNISMNNGTGEDRMLTVTIANPIAQQTASITVSFDVARAIATCINSLSSE